MRQFFYILFNMKKFITLLFATIFFSAMFAIEKINQSDLSKNGKHIKISTYVDEENPKSKLYKYPYCVRVYFTEDENNEKWNDIFAFYYSNARDAKSLFRKLKRSNLTKKFFDEPRYHSKQVVYYDNRQEYVIVNYKQYLFKDYSNER